MPESKINAHALHGLSIAEAFKKYVLNDPDVVSLATVVLKQDRIHTHVFQEGQYPGPYEDYTWPLEIAVDDLAFHFVKPAAFYMGDPLPDASKEVIEVSKILVALIKSMKDLLISGSVVGRGTYAKTGAVGDIARLEWARRGVSIDVQNSDLLETVSDKAVVKWSGITLHAPAAAALRTLVPDGVSSAGRKMTAYRASVEAAIMSLWPKGIPAGMTVQVRDGKIIDWQRKNGQLVTSAKTIKRHLMNR